MFVHKALKDFCFIKVKIKEGSVIQDQEIILSPLVVDHTDGRGSDHLPLLCVIYTITWEIRHRRIKRK